MTLTSVRAAQESCFNAGSVSSVFTEVASDLDECNEESATIESDDVCFDASAAVVTAAGFSIGICLAATLGPLCCIALCIAVVVIASNQQTRGGARGQVVAQPYQQQPVQQQVYVQPVQQPQPQAQPVGQPVMTIS